MADVFTQQKRSEIMSRIKGKDTKPEKIVRSLLHEMGYRFRLHVDNIPGKPDIVLARHHKIIFINGCFWHRHQICRKKKPPKTNAKFWLEKITKNVKRDKLIQKQLSVAGWRVLTIWECEASVIEVVKPKLVTFMKA
jgi:DNA mismatch endonuclease (patch repair protein)